MDKKVFSVLMYKLAKAVREELDSETLAIYYEKLNKYSEQQFAWAVNRASETQRKFPPLALLLEFTKVAPGPAVAPEKGPKLLPEEITSADVAKKRLQAIFDLLNGQFDTTLKV